MTDHLPECPHAEPDLNPGFLVMCICDRLRACEQRVLDAAREAVVGQIAPRIRAAAQLWSCDPDRCALCDCNLNDEGREHIRTIAASEERDALAAIDALREGTK